MPVPTTPGQILLQLPAPKQLVLRCLADVQKAELREGYAFTPHERFHLVQERLNQRPLNN